MNRLIAVIPARSGSKRVPGKNVAMVGGRPLVEWSILWSLEEPEVDAVAVTSDCLEVLSIAARYPFVCSIVRPLSLAQDGTLDLPVMQHAADALELDDDDRILHVRPTTPFREKRLVARMLEVMKRTGASSARTVRRSASIPWKQYLSQGDGIFAPVATPAGLQEAHNMPAQKLPAVYDHDGALDLVMVGTVRSGSMTGPRIAGVVNDYEHHIDIDYPEDLERARQIAAKLNQEAGRWQQSPNSPTS